MNSLRLRHYWFSHFLLYKFDGYWVNLISVDSLWWKYSFKWLFGVMSSSGSNLLNWTNILRGKAYWVWKVHPRGFLGIQVTSKKKAHHVHPWSRFWISNKSLSLVIFEFISWVIHKKGSISYVSFKSQIKRSIGSS